MAPDGDDAVAGHHDIHVVAQAPAATIPERAGVDDLEPARPGRPTWSADGRTIALAALVPFSRSFREGLNQILSFDLAGGADRYTDPIPFKSLSDRFTSGPVW